MVAKPAEVPSLQLFLLQKQKSIAKPLFQVYLGEMRPAPAVVLLLYFFSVAFLTSSIAFKITSEAVLLCDKAGQCLSLCGAHPSPHGMCDEVLYERGSFTFAGGSARRNLYLFPHFQGTDEQMEAMVECLTYVPLNSRKVDDAGQDERHQAQACIPECVDEDRTSPAWSLWPTGQAVGSSRCSTLLGDAFVEGESVGLETKLTISRSEARTLVDAGSNLMCYRDFSSLDCGSSASKFLMSLTFSVLLSLPLNMIAEKLFRFVAAPPDKRKCPCVTKCVLTPLAYALVLVAYAMAVASFFLVEDYPGNTSSQEFAEMAITAYFVSFFTDLLKLCLRWAIFTRKRFKLPVTETLQEHVALKKDQVTPVVGGDCQQHDSTDSTDSDPETLATAAITPTPQQMPPVPAPVPGPALLCHNCGSNIPFAVRFCASCGAPQQ